ncbi:hypothetical protein SXCC_04091 [Gluconacetobacter sp. SXCC-1]|nr:hypothetical protein SXCC_04091 [Gluconacetobacter sp. SXCC-1]
MFPLFFTASAPHAHGHAAGWGQHTRFACLPATTRWTGFTAM